MGYTSEMLNLGRILRVGKITSLAEDFRLPDGSIFSLFLVPKTGTYNDIEIINCRLYEQEKNTSADCPFNVGGWTEPAVVMVKASNAALLDTYDVYWGAGDDSNVK